MRKNFIKSLLKESKTNKDTILVVGDLGFSVVESFQKKYPKRFFNAGVAEQNMAGMAAGLASEGCHVFTYSIANFNTFRCAEQIRNDIDYHDLPVTGVTVGGGLAYGSMGYSHHALQDYSLMRSSPNMTIYSPGDSFELIECMRHIFNEKKPSYLRLSKDDNKEIHKKNLTLSPGKWVKVSSKKKLSKKKKCILSTGAVLDDALKMQMSEYTDYDIYSLPIWGMNYKALQKKYISRWDEIITLEDHLEDGGFGSFMLEASSSHGLSNKIRIKSLDKKVCGMVGSQGELKKLTNFSS